MADPEKLFLRAAELLKLGIVPSKPTLWRWVSLGEFPQPIKLGPGTTVFRKADVDRWLEDRVGDRHAVAASEAVA